MTDHANHRRIFEHSGRPEVRHSPKIVLSAAVFWQERSFHTAWTQSRPETEITSATCPKAYPTFMLPSNALFVVLHKQPRLALRLSLVICFEMPTFMFWNIAKNDVSEAIAAACIENEIDVLIMAECNIPEVKLLTKLNSGSSRQTYTEIHKGVSQLRMFTRLPESGVTAVYDDGRVAIRRIAPPVGGEVLLVAAHLPSKLHTDKETQYLRVRGVRSEIDRAEKKAGHKNTIIIGDLNIESI